MTVTGCYIRNHQIKKIINKVKHIPAISIHWSTVDRCVITLINEFENPTKLVIFNNLFLVCDNNDFWCHNSSVTFLTICNVCVTDCKLACILDISSAWVNLTPFLFAPRNNFSLSCLILTNLLLCLLFFSSFSCISAYYIQTN